MTATAERPETKRDALITEVRRMGTIMRPAPNRPEEVEGVLNPAAVRNRRGHLYLFPRVVGRGNYSRIVRTRVVFYENGDPAGVLRLGTVLEPEEEYERHPGGGGCEDPRVTYVPALGRYLMTYVAWGATGPRVALAVSDDLVAWKRAGLLDFCPDPEPVYCTDFGAYHNKDGAVFPETVPGPDGRLSLAILHRPVYQTARIGGVCCEVPCGIRDPRPGIWISYCALENLQNTHRGRLPFKHHHLLADPEQPWESDRIGAGPPPIRTELGWLLIYHGVSREDGPDRDAEDKAVYRAGVMLLDLKDPRRVLYRSPVPILEPETEEERRGTVSHVVFPTGLDVRNATGQPNRIDMYYGMADASIGVAALTLRSGVLRK